MSMCRCRQRPTSSRAAKALYAGARRPIVEPVKSVDLIGWVSSLVLLATLIRQVYTQWKTKATTGLSKWLFVGQLTASAGFVVYSYMLRNWVYVFSNIALLVTAIVGQTLYLRNKRSQRSRS
jgi:MtN3 and saliva related transmembrane protein